MNHLIIYAHPNKGSLNHYLMQKVMESLDSGHHKTILRDLYQLSFNPVLSMEDMDGQRRGRVAEDVKKEQEYISWADQITFIYPIWWTGMPGIMKGYIDRVFSYGFAYCYDQGIQKGLLEGKLTVIINTLGKSQDEYEHIGMDRALSLTSDKGIFTYCGLEIKHHFFFGKADRATSEEIQNWVIQIKSSFPN